MRTFKRLVKTLILAYVTGGVVYSLTGYVERMVAGKQEVFSPLIGIPLDVAGWPEMVYADLKHIGVLPRDVLAPIAAVVFVAVAVGKAFTRARG